MDHIKMHEQVIEGIKVLYVHVPFSLNTHVGFFSLSGSFAENEKNQGVSHYLEHLFFKGTKKRDLFMISEDAALLGAEQNAYTSEYNTHYYLNVPKVNTEGAIELLCDMMFNPTFPEEEIEKERTVIQEERKMYEDDPKSSFFEASEMKFFGFQTGHKIVGTEETINSLTKEDFLDFHGRLYGKNTTILVIVGDIGIANITYMCSKYLKNNPFKDNEIVRVEPVILAGSLEDFVFPRPNIQQTYLMGLFSGKGIADKDRAKMVCMLNALGGGMYSPFFKEIREKLGLCYTVWAFDYIHNGICSALGTYIQTDPSKVNLAKNKMIEIIDNVRKNGFDIKSFECAKASQLGSFCRETSDVSRIANIVGKHVTMGVNIDFAENYEGILNLTFDDVNEYASKNLPESERICWSQMNPGE